MCCSRPCCLAFSGFAQVRLEAAAEERRYRTLLFALPWLTASRHPPHVQFVGCVLLLVLASTALSDDQGRCVLTVGSRGESALCAVIESLGLITIFSALVLSVLQVGHRERWTSLWTPAPPR